MRKKDIACIILAAGKGERMKSATPKVLHQVCGRPMLSYVLDITLRLRARRSVVVLGHKYRQIRPIISPAVKIAVQKKLLGTADAVKTALGALKGFRGTVVILYGDIPLLTRETLRRLISYHQQNHADATLLTAQLEKPFGYGRILRDEYESICGIAEEKDADDFQKGIKEINTGIICFDKEKLERALPLVRPNNRKKEYYLTDVIALFHRKGFIIEEVRLPDINEALGINSRIDLARASSIMRQRINEALMKQGVTITEPACTFIDYGARIGKDTVIYPFTVIGNNVTIGKFCSVGPFIHLRNGTRIEDGVCVGNFLEIVRTKLSKGTLVKHFGYLGDSRIGREVNVGAGVVTANFDGRRKNTTVIKDYAFVGSDTILVAPSRVGSHAVTGAGSVILRKTRVPDHAVVAGVPARLIKKKNPS